MSKAYVKTGLFLAIFIAGLLSLFPCSGLCQNIILPPDYVNLVQQRVSSNIAYPMEAQKKGWEGVVVVRLVLKQNGSIKMLGIAESSGYPVLDEAAMSAVEKAGPYPYPKQLNQAEELEIILPISYTGIDKPSAIYQAKSEQMPVQAKQETPQRNTLTGLIELAKQNNQPLKVAEEEIELAEFKIFEEQRNLFPALKIAGYTSDGEVSKVDYEEWESRLELSQPLFYGGKLRDAVKQARVNLEISKKNYEWLDSDLRQKVETAYYNLLAPKIHLEYKELILEEAGEMLEKIERLSEAGMVIPLELKSARSWFEQIQLQIDSIKQEIAMAELSLKQVLDSEELPEIEIPRLLEARELGVDLATCKQTALENHPEIHLSQLLVEYNNYSQKIKQAEANAFTADLVSSYGHYEGHYKVLPWDDADNWFVGIKVSKPWGASTINTSYDNEDTVARFGRTSPSSYSALSAELNLFDNLKRLSDKKKSDIDTQRSISDAREIIKAVTLEVQDAFLKYQKALLELNSAQTQMEFRRSETEVSKMRAMVGEANLSSALESLYTLSEAETKYIQALANYQIALVDLKKATGYAIPI